MSPVISNLIVAGSLDASIPWAEFEHGILESAGDVRFVALSGQAPDEFACEVFSAGTLFSVKAELRWRLRRNGRYHLVLIHDEGKTLGSEEGSPLWPVERKNDDALPGHVLLWRPDGEPRIPYPIIYPGMPAGVRPRVGLKHYWLENPPERADRVLITRYVTLLTAEAEP